MSVRHIASNRRLCPNVLDWQLLVKNLLLILPYLFFGLFHILIIFALLNFSRIWGSLRASLLCVVGEVAGISDCGCLCKWQVTGDRWQVTGDRWYAIRNIWQVTDEYIYIFFGLSFWDFHGIGATNCSRQDIDSLLYAGFLKNYLKVWK